MRKAKKRPISGPQSEDGGTVWTMRISRRQRAKLGQLGGADWVRARIERAKVTTCEKKDEAPGG